MINHNAVNPKDLPGTARTILLIDRPNTDVLRASLKERLQFCVIHPVAIQKPK